MQFTTYFCHWCSYQKKCIKLKRERYDKCIDVVLNEKRENVTLKGEMSIDNFSMRPIRSRRSYEGIRGQYAQSVERIF
jgi:hypothetical protein